MKVVNPKLTLEDSAAGSLEMTLPHTNKAYDTIVRMVTEISVKSMGKRFGLGVCSQKVRTSGTTVCSTVRGNWLISTTQYSPQQSMPASLSGSIWNS